MPNGGTVLKADKSGLSVTGKITATSGVIGGLTIKDGYLSTNGQTWGGTNTNGIYFGPNGIQLGKYFTVDSSGNLTAYSGKFLGTVQAGSIDYGGNAGTCKLFCGRRSDRNRCHCEQAYHVRVSPPKHM